MFLYQYEWWYYKLYNIILLDFRFYISEVTEVKHNQKMELGTNVNYSCNKEGPGYLLYF